MTLPENVLGILVSLLKLTLCEHLKSAAALNRLRELVVLDDSSVGGDGVYGGVHGGGDAGTEKHDLVIEAEPRLLRMKVVLMNGTAVALYLIVGAVVVVAPLGDKLHTCGDVAVVNLHRAGKGVGGFPGAEADTSYSTLLHILGSAGEAVCDVDVVDKVIAVVLVGIVIGVEMECAVTGVPAGSVLLKNRLVVDMTGGRHGDTECVAVSVLRRSVAGVPCVCVLVVILVGDGIIVEYRLILCEVYE